MKKLILLLAVIALFASVASYAESIHEKELSVIPVELDGKTTYQISDSTGDVIFIVKNPLVDGHRIKGSQSAKNPQGLFQIGSRRYIEDVVDKGAYILIYTFELRGSRFMRVSLRSEPKGDITPFVEFKSGLENNSVASL